MGRPPLGLTHRRFGRLIALEYVASRRWRCRCDCGTIVIVWRSSLRKGTCQSCGCLQREQLAARRTTHGATRPGRVTTEYNIWRGMKIRCLMPTNHAWKNYGGRGITICDRWRESFAAFLEDMGPRPSYRFTIDRIDNDGPYEPGNCRWAVSRTQSGNKRGNRVMTFRGKTQHMAAWARDLNVPVHQISNRLRRGWSVERALSEPPNDPHGQSR